MAPTVSVTDRPRHDAFPLDRPTEQVIAERLLATALYNYHQVMTGHAQLADFLDWSTLTETQRAFLVSFAVPAAIQAVWHGR